MLIDKSGGKAIVIDMPADRLALSSVLTAAAGAPISLVANDLEATDELMAALDTAETFAPPDARYGHLEIVIAFDSTGDADALPEELDRFAGLMLRHPPHQYQTEYLLALLGLARRCRKPVYAFVEDDWQLNLEDVVRIGLDRIIVAPGNAAEVKDAIREL